MIVARHSSSSIECARALAPYSWCVCVVSPNCNLDSHSRSSVMCINYAFSNHIPICSATNDMRRPLKHVSRHTHLSQTRAHRQRVYCSVSIMNKKKRRCFSSLIFVVVVVGKYIIILYFEKAIHITGNLNRKRRDNSLQCANASLTNLSAACQPASS